MTLLVRDEEDILEANLRYHLARGVDFIVATDNNSTDATPEILETFARQGRLRVLHEEGETWHQEEWVTRMARLAATEHGADWVINNDADEFWWPRVGSLKDAFAAVPDRFGAVTASRINFIPRSGEDLRFYERMTIAEMRSLKQGRKRAEVVPVTGKRAHRASPDVTVSRGSHRIYPRETFPPVPGWRPFFVFHFPLRSYEQLERRTRLPETVYAQIPPGERTNLFELHQAGKLRDYWDAKLLGDAEVGEGLRSGRLCVEDRLKRFMEALDAGGPDAADLVGRTPNLRLELRHAADQRAWKERGRARLNAALADAQLRAAKAEQRAEKAERRRERVEHEVGRLESRLCARLARVFSRRR
jgi:hypothetical protein